MSVGVFRLRALSYLFNSGVGIVEGHRSQVTFIPADRAIQKWHSFGLVVAPLAQEQLPYRLGDFLQS
jgi:hypothetical protein